LLTEVPLVGIALCGEALAAIYQISQIRKEGQKMATKATKVTIADIKKAFWRYVFFSQCGWNYERMQSVGYCYSMHPLSKNPPDLKNSRKRSSQPQLYNTNPILGTPLNHGRSYRVGRSRRLVRYHRRFEGRFDGTFGRRRRHTGLGSVQQHHLQHLLKHGSGRNSLAPSWL
jgi:hypothetical protein